VDQTINVLGNRSSQALRSRRLHERHIGRSVDQCDARDPHGYHGDVGMESLRQYRHEILDAAARHGVRDVRVFGSIARGDDHENSDVDFLVDVEPGRTLLDVIAFEQDVQQLLGRNVDVLTDGGLSPYLQQRILAEAASLRRTIVFTCNTSATHSMILPPTRARAVTHSSPKECARTPRFGSSR
jgi:uncharacterized protein